MFPFLVWGTGPKTFAFLLTLSFIFVVTAQADLLCAKKNVRVKNGTISLANSLKTVTSDSCPAGYKSIKDLSDVNDKNIIGFARIAEDGSITNFGGSKITSDTASALNTGDTFFEVTLNGNFTGLAESDSASNRSKLTVLTTGYAFDYGVTNASIVSATSSTIVLDVFLFRSTDHAADFQRGVMLAVFKGS